MNHFEASKMRLGFWYWIFSRKLVKKYLPQFVVWHPAMVNHFILRATLGLLFLAVFAYPSAAHQDKTASPTQVASPIAVDRFIGIWKLNLDKSSRTGTVSELITIESQESNVKFTYDWLAENTTELHWSVEHTQVNGRPMSSESRIARLDSYRFTDESSMKRDQYQVSADGQTMTIQRTNLFNPAPHKIPKEMRLVFERQK
jgi:hypothetical protein